MTQTKTCQSFLILVIGILVIIWLLVLACLPVGREFNAS
jgi:hypothetical protein